MFEDLRWRITLMFVGLAAGIYITLTFLGLLMFENGLTTSLDRELRVVASEIGHAIMIDNGKPRFRDWIRMVKTDPPRSLATIQLYDVNGGLLEHYGPEGVEKFLSDTKESMDNNKSVRILCTPLIQDGQEIGFVQIQRSTTERDQALLQLRWNACLIGVLFLLALSAASYWLAKKVTQPVHDSVQILRSFIADASHELNTPLTILQARTESLARRLSKAGMEEEDLQIAMKSVDRLNKVVSDLLLLSEVEDPFSGITKAPVDSLGLVNQIVAEQIEKFEAKAIDLKAHVVSPSFIKGNKEALHRLLANLVENALRYTNEGGKVEIKVENVNKHVQILVNDTGIGIPAESLPRVFDRFFRVDKSRSRASGGTGLGLAIVRAITDAHHGTVSVESEIGVGTTFTVVLPEAKI